MNRNLVFDMSESGLRIVLKDYQEIALRVIWESHEGLRSKQVLDRVNDRLKDKTISRASVINFLEDMREMGALSGVEETGKGGYHWVYSPAMDESGFKRFIAEKLIGSLRNSFPDELSPAIEKLVK